jgi:lipopolysaccharide biosynthesis glycosyltransferase
MYAIALCVDTNYLVPAIVTLSSIATAVPRSERTDIAVAVTAPAITPSQALTLSHAVERLGFASCAIRQVQPPPTSWLRHGTYITAATYLRFSLAKTHIDRPYLVYLDADLIVLAGLADAFDHIEPTHIGVVRDELVQSIGRDEALPGFADTYPHHRGAAYYNAGAIWLTTDNLASFRTGSLRHLRSHARHIHFNDQDALNLWLLHEQRAAPLPAAYNRFELARFRERSDWITRAAGPHRSLTDAKVIHFIGSRKPWLTTCPGTEAVTTYRALLEDTRRLLRRLGDLVLYVPTSAAA